VLVPATRGASASPLRRWSMADFEDDVGTDAATTGDRSIEDIVGSVRDDIHLGHIDDDVTNVLEERIRAAGLTLRPEDIDTLAEEIENDSSR
jgi:hypothetical protein